MKTIKQTNERLKNLFYKVAQEGDIKQLRDILMIVSDNELKTELSKVLVHLEGLNLYNEINKEVM